MRMIQQKSLAIILIFIVIIANLTVAADGESNWPVLGNSAFAEGTVVESDFCVSNGTAYVAYRTNVNMYRIMVKKFNGSSWEAVGSEQECVYNTPDIEIDISNGTPYLLYRESTGEFSSRTTIKKFVNGTWEELNKQGIGTNISGIDFQIDNGTPYVAIKTNIGPNSNSKLSVMKYNETGWGSVGNAEFLVGKLLDVKLCVSNGIPYVASRTSDTKKLKVMKLFGNSWVNLGEDVNNEGYSVSMDIYNNIPYIVYSNSTSKITVKKYEGSMWGDVGNIIISGRIGAPALQVSNGKPLLSYVNFEKVNIMKYNGTVWEPLSENIASARAAQLVVENDSLYIGLSEGSSAQISKIARYNQPGAVNTSGTTPSNQNNTIPQVNLDQISTKPTTAIAGAGSLVFTDLSVSAVAGNGSIKLRWNSLSHMKGLVGYHVYKSTIPGGQTDVPETNSWIKDTTYTDTKVQPGIAYYYIVKPVLIGTASKEVSATETGLGTGSKSIIPGANQLNSQSWSGIWETDYGRMMLMQNGTEVSGVYGDKEYKISGTSTGNKLVGIIDEGGADQGEVEFIMSSGGSAFSGKWRYRSDIEWSIWNGSRK